MLCPELPEGRPWMTWHGGDRSHSVGSCFCDSSAWEGTTDRCQPCPTYAFEGPAAGTGPPVAVSAGIGRSAEHACDGGQCRRCRCPADSRPSSPARWLAPPMRRQPAPGHVSQRRGNPGVDFRDGYEPGTAPPRRNSARAPWTGFRRTPWRPAARRCIRGRPPQNPCLRQHPPVDRAPLLPRSCSPSPGPLQARVRRCRGGAPYPRRFPETELRSASTDVSVCVLAVPTPRGCTLRLLRSRVRGLPLEHQNRGVVADFVVSMLEDGMDESAQHFWGASAPLRSTG